MPLAPEDLDHFLPLIATDAVFRQPLAADAHGHDEIARMFRSLPDTVAVPRHWAVSGELVFIESDCTETPGSRRFAFVVFDRFVVRDGLIASRHSAFDSARGGRDPRLPSRVGHRRPRARPHHDFLASGA